MAQIFKNEAEERFKSILGNIKRRGMTELLQYLKTTDFYRAPASTKYHGAYEGGLVVHSVAVYDNLVKICKVMGDNGAEISAESMAITALLHDVCKADFYVKDWRNVKINGVWKQQPYYRIEDRLPLGHGEKSVIILQRFIKLSEEETLAIRWHMGGFDVSAANYGGISALSAAMGKYPLVVFLHTADLLASNVDKR